MFLRRAVVTTVAHFHTGRVSNITYMYASADSDFSEPDAKKLAGSGPPPNQGGAPPNNQGLPGPPPRGGPGMGGPGMGGPGMGGPMGGPQINEDIKVPDKMVGLSEYIVLVFFLF